MSNNKIIIGTIAVCHRHITTTSISTTKTNRGKLIFSTKINLSALTRLYEDLFAKEIMTTHTCCGGIRSDHAARESLVVTRL